MRGGRDGAHYSTADAIPFPTPDTRIDQPDRLESCLTVPDLDECAHAVEDRNVPAATHCNVTMRKQVREARGCRHESSPCSTCKVVAKGISPRRAVPPNGDAGGITVR